MMSGQEVARPVVVGVDGSKSALGAVRWAADEAARRQVPLQLVHALIVPFMTYRSAVLRQNVEDALLDQARRWLQEAADAARARSPGIDLREELQEGPTASALLMARSRTAQLLVLGSRGLGGFTELLVGSVAVALAAHGDAPVVVVRGRAPDAPPPEIGPVVVGVDGSPASEAAVAFAFDHASRRGVELVAVYVCSDVVIESAFASAQLVLDWETIEADEQRLLAHRLAGWQEKYPDVLVRRVVTRGRPVHSMLSQAEHAQLVVVGSRGRGGFAGMLLGSTSQALLHHAACPVAVVRPGQ